MITGSPRRMTGSARAAAAVVYTGNRDDVADIGRAVVATASAIAADLP